MGQEIEKHPESRGQDLEESAFGKETQVDKTISKDGDAQRSPVQEAAEPKWLKKRGHRETVLIIANFLLVICNVWLAVSTHQLSKDSREQAKAVANQANATADMAAEMKRNAGIAQRGIDLAEKNAKLNEESTKIQMRPYPILQVHHAHNVLYVSIKNFGQTPAVNLHGVVKVTFETARVPAAPVHRHFMIGNVTLGSYESFIDSVIIPTGYEIPKGRSLHYGPIVTVHHSYEFSNIWGERKPDSGQIHYQYASE
jgi:hypothetical protein